MEKREIKFRAWCEGTHDNLTFQKPIMDYEIVLSKEGNYLDVENDWDIHGEYKSIPVMQFTGLKDKNGKEIYEGDICRVLYTDWCSKSESDSRTLEQYLIDISSILICIYSVNGFYFSSNIDGYAQSMEVGKHGYIEVIGNIYENPELLNTGA